jgi:hypothetical protein
MCVRGGNRAAFAIAGFLRVSCVGKETCQDRGMPRPSLDEKIQKQIRHLSREGKSAEDIRRALESFGTKVSGPTIRRYMVTAEAGAAVAAAPPSAPTVAQRVAALAPPPAEPAEPPEAFDLAGEPADQIRALGRLGQRLIAVAERARASCDVDGERRALAEAAELADRIRHLRRSEISADGTGFYSSRDDVRAAQTEIRRRLDEVAHARGETLCWTLDAEIPECDGGPKVSRA